jgi:hypothetical protein
VADQVVERHRGDHRRVAERLKFQVADVYGALELEDDQSPFPVDAQRVDAPLGVSEGPELLRHDEHVIGDRVDTSTK